MAQEQPSNNQEAPSLKLKTARTLKWNSINKFAEQVLYAVTGIVLANIVSQEDFGLVGAILVFQAFAALFVDSGFSSALIQRKEPSTLDYSTVFWFNLAMSAAIYAVLWFAAPLIDSLFHAGGRLVPLSRVMFLTFMLNSTALVQTNRLIKQMNVRLVAVSNVVGLLLSGAIGIWLAVEGYGAWAIVWQSVSLAAVKSAILWLFTSWHPTMQFSWHSLRTIFKVGAGVMTSSFLNILSQNIYSFVIGAFYSLSQLGCYTQADKWSKMGVASLSSILTTTFLPVLSGVQDDRERLFRMVEKTNRLSAYLVMPCMLMLVVAAPAIFHVLFGTKWDNAIVLFQLLAVRGVFIIMAAVYYNFLLSVGHAKSLVYSELIKDTVLVAAIVVTVPYGITWLVIGQVIAGVISWAANIVIVRHVMGYSAWQLLLQTGGSVLMSLAAVAAAAALALLIDNAWLLLPAQLVAGAAVYLILGALMRSGTQREVLDYALGRFRRGNKA
ncbi:MAG: lipopolysaccharide biosynthesis protein [Muribaculaceae bacterium]